MPTTLPDARLYPRFSGIATFCRYPLLEQVAAADLPLDWVIYGVPFDGGVSYRPGARFGPRAIRAESQYIKRYSIEHDVDVPAVLSIADGGDAPVRPYSCVETMDAVARFAGALGDRTRTRLFAVGGDHSIAYANMKATWERRGRKPLALLHFDSHLDTVDVLWGEKYSHASPFVRAIEEGIIDPRRMLTVGIKGPLNSADDLKYAREKGVTVLTCEQWHRSVREGRREIQDFVAMLAGADGGGADGGAEAYLSFDIDCVDPAHAPGTGTPSIGGLSSAEVLTILRSLKGANIVGADVVEVLPDRDVAGITALLAAQIIFEVLSLDALRAAKQRAAKP
jgi:agmatinase